MLADLTLVRAKYGPSQLTPLEPYDAVRLLVSELLDIMDSSAPLSACQKYCEQVLFRCQQKLIVSEEVMDESTQGARTFLPHKGNDTQHNNIDLELIKWEAKPVGSKTETLKDQAFDMVGSGK